MSLDTNAVKELGFESEGELVHMVASVDISTFEKLKAFSRWKEFDGTKEGLLKLGTRT